jgi:hypothetical protein
VYRCILNILCKVIFVPSDKHGHRGIRIRIWMSLTQVYLSFYESQYLTRKMYISEVSLLYIIIFQLINVLYFNAFLQTQLWLPVFINDKIWYFDPCTVFIFYIQKRRKVFFQHLSPKTFIFVSLSLDDHAYQKARIWLCIICSIYSATLFPS